MLLTLTDAPSDTETPGITFGDWCLWSENVCGANASVRSTSESLIHFEPVLAISLLFCSPSLSIAPVYVTLCHSYTG